MRRDHEGGAERLSVSLSEQARSAGDSAGASVPALLDRFGFRARQAVIVIMVLTALMFDGLHMQLLSFVAPVLLKQWALSKTQLGPAMAAALIGITVGASIGGWLGDRIGLKRTLVASVAFFGAFTLATAASWDLSSLIVLRFISGIGLGAATPTGIALAVEWLPSRLKARAVALLTVSAPLGGALGAITVAALLPRLGWRVTFGAVGTVTIVVALVLLIVLPEAWSYLMRKGKTAQASKTIAAVTGVSPAQFNLANAPQVDVRQRRRWRAAPVGYGRLFAGSGLAYFCASFISFAFIAWGPVILTAKGMTLTQALSALFWMNITGVVVTLCTPMLLARWSSLQVLRSANVAVFAVITALALLLAAKSGGIAPVGIVLAIQVGLALLGGSLGMAVTTLWTLMATTYPAQYRATGLGLGTMMGRAGCVTILLAGGALIGADIRLLSAFFASVFLAGLGSFVGAAIIGLDRPDRQSAEPAHPC